MTSRRTLLALSLLSVSGGGIWFAIGGSREAPAATLAVGTHGEEGGADRTLTELDPPPASRRALDGPVEDPVAPGEESPRAGAPEEESEDRLAEIRRYRAEELARTIDVFCKGEGGRRGPGDSQVAQAQTLVVLSLATILDARGRGEIATGPRAIGSGPTEEREFSVNGIWYRFHTAEFPVYDQLLDFLGLESGSEAANPHRVGSEPRDPWSVPDSFRGLVCRRAAEALEILERRED